MQLIAVREPSIVTIGCVADAPTDGAALPATGSASIPAGCTGASPGR
jgi:hypothetical protein